MASEVAADPATSHIDVWPVGQTWLRRATEVLTGSADALNAMNVFPISDADTGSNLLQTVRGITAAAPFTPEGMDTLAQAAILSAHGNSGAIVAQMLTSVCRRLRQQTAEPNPPAPGTAIADLFVTAASAARQAVARPVDGTILTVADAAAEAARAAAVESPTDPLQVVRHAQRAASVALSHTPEQLEVLGRSGVVDAGAQGFVLLVDCLVEALGGAPAQPLPPLSTAPPQAVAHPTPPRSPEYEVMYAIRGADDDALDGLRTVLSGVGHSVVLVGDASVAQVHVHLAEPGAAVEAALGLGQLSQIRITALDDTTVAEVPTRTVLSVVAGPGIATAVREMGGEPLEAPTPAMLLEELEATISQGCGDVIVLPNDMESLELARSQARLARAVHRRVAVIPTVAQVQGLAAIAVHEPTADFDAAVVAMSTAAAHTRSGAVTIAESPAMTMAGRCQVGDVLGVVGGDFVEIGDDVLEVAWRVVLRMLAAGGELLTVVVGADCDDAVADRLERRARASAPGVEVERVEGGQRRYLLLMGLA